MNERIVSDVFAVYEFLKDSMKVTKRSINAEMHNLHRSTLFFLEQKEIMANKFEDVEGELDAIMILSLFASFERELRISIQASIEKNTSKVNPTLRRLAFLMTNSIERWTVEDMINAMEDVVDAEIRSKAKQIYEYRNWVAHGRNPEKKPAIRTDPKTVQVTLIDFMLQAKNAL